MKKYTHHISAIALLLLVLSILISACTSSESREGIATTSEEKVITSSQLGSKPFTSTAKTTGTTTDEEVTTTAPTTTEAPVTTTIEPITATKAPVTTTTAPITTKPTTTTQAPVTTTTAPMTTTTVPVTTTAPHTHSYGPWNTTKAATCTADGTQTRTCACGKSETKTIAASGHSYGTPKVTKEATCSATGTKTATCKNCGDQKTETIAKTNHKYGTWTLCSDYINEEATCKTCGATETQIHYADPETDERLVADRVIYYINEYRKKEGSTVATKLPRYTLVAEMRSTYLVGLTSSSDYYEWHDEDDWRASSTYYEYGQYIDPEEWGFEGEPYYRAPGREAVGSDAWGSTHTIDALAYTIAFEYHRSEGHWSYLGSSDYSYIAVGLTYYAKTKTVYSAILVCDTDQYE